MNVAIAVRPDSSSPTIRSNPARLRAPMPVRVRFDAFELDEANALLLREGKAVALAPRPFGVLCALARRPGDLQTKHALLDDVWGHQFVSDSVLKTAISDLRIALDDDAREPRFIETVSRRGYRFIARTMAPLADVARDGRVDQPATIRARTGEGGCTIPPPLYATPADIDFARELKRRLRACYLGGGIEELSCA